jgi:hypothetical protein
MPYARHEADEARQDDLRLSLRHLNDPTGSTPENDIAGFSVSFSRLAVQLMAGLRPAIHVIVASLLILWPQQRRGRIPLRLGFPAESRRWLTSNLFSHFSVRRL